MALEDAALLSLLQGLRDPNILGPGVSVEEGAAPCSSIPTSCAASSTICAQEGLRMEMCCIWNPLPPSAEGLGHRACE